MAAFAAWFIHAWCAEQRQESSTDAGAICFWVVEAVSLVTLLYVLKLSAANGFG